jgi:hypothetical protein
MDPQATYYTMTNLRIRGRRLTSVNEWRGHTILPVCTPVQIRGVNRGRIVFIANGQTYQFVYHRRASSVTADIEAQRIFGAACPVVASMLPADQMGIQAGRPLVGMSRQGVLIAAGYPPDSRTPALEMSPWTYWGERGGVQVHFQGDTVVSVQGHPAEPAVVQAQSAMVAGVQPVGGGGGVAVVPVTQDQQAQGPETVPTIVVTDANGYPVEVPVAEIGRTCDAGNPCHQALTCVPSPSGGGACEAPR